MSRDTNCANDEGSATGSEGREGVGFTERGEEGRLEAAERESERRAGIQCHGGSGTDRTDFMRPSVLRTGESGEESKGESLGSDRTASGGEEVSSTGTSAAEGVSENRGEAGSSIKPSTFNLPVMCLSPNIEQTMGFSQILQIGGNC